MEQTKVQQQDDARHSDPASKQRMGFEDEPRHHPDECRAQHNVGDGGNPFAGARPGHRRFPAQENRRIHAKPGQQIAGFSGATRGGTMLPRL